MTSRPDPSFYPSAREAGKAPAERLAYVALPALAGTGRRDGIGVVDVDPASTTFGTLVKTVEFPTGGNDGFHLGWNACSARLCPYAPAGHVERRYLIVPGTRSARIHVVDTRPVNDGGPRLARVVEPELVIAKTGYTAPRTVRSGPDGIYLTALGAPDGGGPGGILLLDHETFKPCTAWERDRGPQYIASDFAWHLGHDTMITSEWGTPNLLARGFDPDLLEAERYGTALHVWDLRRRTHQQVLALGDHHQMILALRPAHDPRRAYGFAACAMHARDLSSSVWMWYREPGAGRWEWKVRKVIDVPAEPATGDLPAVLRRFGVIPPLVTDLGLSIDDQSLYVPCWGTGACIRYDVSDPFHPRRTASVRIGGLVRHAAHPGAPGRAVAGGPGTVEVSRDGRRVYLTSSVSASWDTRFHPDGLRGWLVQLSADATGALSFDGGFLCEFDEGVRAGQVRLAGGDASSDSFCYA